MMKKEGEEGMVRKIAVALGLIMLLTPVYRAFSQAPPPGRWWRRPRIARVLNLSEREKQRLDELFVKSRKRLIKLKSKVEEARFDLENLLEEESLDETAIMDQFHELDRARSQLDEERFRFLLGVRKIVGYDRFEKLKELYRRLRQKRRAN